MFNLQDSLQKNLQGAHECVQFILECFSEIKTMKLKQLQVWFEKNFSKQTKLAWIEEHLIESEDLQEKFNSNCEESGLNAKLVKKVLAVLALHRRVDCQTMLNMFKHHFNSLKELTEFFDKVIELTFVQYENGIFIVQPCFSLTKEQQFILELFQSNMCMLVPPKKVRKMKNNKLNNGYLVTRRTIWSRKADDHNEAADDFLNLQNHVAYQLNYRMWKTFGIYHPEIPEREPDDADYEYEKKLKEAVRHHAKKAFILELYEKLGIKEIYILNFYDYRFRNYPVAYLFNPQGQDSDKALLCFKPENITPNGRLCLDISIANCFNDVGEGVSLDKLTYKERVQWVKAQVYPQLDLPYEEFIAWLNQKAEEAESPSCFWAQVENLWHIHQAQREGRAGQSWVITHFDATASGYQIQAIFAKDWEMGKLTNITPNKQGLRMDVYTELYKQLILMGIPNTYTRNQVKKKCFVPAVYNSTLSIKELFIDPREQKIFHTLMKNFSMWRMNRLFPSLWNKEWTEYSYYLPDACRVYKQIKKRKDYLVKFREKDIILSEVSVEPLEYSLELGPNITHSCDGFLARELARMLNFNPRWKVGIYYLYLNKRLWTYTEDERGSRALMQKLLDLGKKFNFYSMRILHEVTASNIDLIPSELFEKLYSELPEIPCPISEIHDSFGVPPNHVFTLMLKYKELMVKLSESDFLGYVVEQLTGHRDSRFEFGIDKEFTESIKKGFYALC